MHMIGLGQTLLFCFLIFLDIVSSLHLRFSNDLGEAGHFQTTQHVFVDSILGNIMLVAAGRRRENYDTDCAFCLNYCAKLASTHFTLESTRSRFKTTFVMVVKGPSGSTQHVAGLDTGAEENLISEQKALDLNVRMVPYDGGVLDSISNGEPVRPIGWVTIQYGVSGRPSWYEAKFAVLEDRHCEQFQILLSAEEIEKRSFYIRNGAVFWCRRSQDKSTDGPEVSSSEILGI
ncbi:MAG: hypothetical protein Q9223_002282 [Gallowayella weberi]